MYTPTPWPTQMVSIFIFNIIIIIILSRALPSSCADEEEPGGRLARAAVAANPASEGEGASEGKGASEGGGRTFLGNGPGIGGFGYPEWVTFNWIPYLPRGS
jgi:hypothetical protein